MQKPVCSLILGLFVVYMNANGMQEDIASSAIEPAAQRVINVVSEVATDSSTCHSCTIKNICKRVFAICKKHSLTLAACFTIIAVVICNVVPEVREKVRALFAKSLPKQSESTVSEIHMMPQEKL
jgi:hypothetical protein